MFIALNFQHQCAPAERHVFYPVRLHAAPNGAGVHEGAGAINMLLLRSKNPQYPRNMTFVLSALTD